MMCFVVISFEGKGDLLVPVNSVLFGITLVWNLILALVCTAILVPLYAAVLFIGIFVEISFMKGTNPIQKGEC